MWTQDTHGELGLCRRPCLQLPDYWEADRGAFDDHGAWDKEEMSRRWRRWHWSMKFGVGCFNWTLEDGWRLLSTHQDHFRWNFSQICSSIHLFQIVFFSVFNFDQDSDGWKLSSRQETRRAAGQAIRTWLKTTGATTTSTTTMILLSIRETALASGSVSVSGLPQQTLDQNFGMVLRNNEVCKE